MSELSIEIQEMLESGVDVSTTAATLNVPLQWVIAEADRLAEYMGADDCFVDGPELEEDYDYDHDGQPDEAQEWHDFDPDC
jgi:hypothetical protein